jgi:hypothetical protein
MATRSGYRRDLYKLCKPLQWPKVHYADQLIGQSNSRARERFEEDERSPRLGLLAWLAAPKNPGQLGCLDQPFQTGAPLAGLDSAG